MDGRRLLEPRSAKLAVEPRVSRRDPVPSDGRSRPGFLPSRDGPKSARPSHRSPPPVHLASAPGSPGLVAPPLALAKSLALRCVAAFEFSVQGLSDRRLVE